MCAEEIVACLLLLAASAILSLAAIESICYKCKKHAIRKRLILACNGVDWIAIREMAGYDAYVGGERDLNEAFSSRELDCDNDADMAFAIGWEKAKKETNAKAN